MAGQVIRGGWRMDGDGPQVRQVRWYRREEERLVFTPTAAQLDEWNVARDRARDVRAALTERHHCHCLACRRRTGSVFGVQARFDAEQVTTEGASRQYIRVSDDGEKRISHFCPGCGATVFLTTEASPEVVAVPVGAFADLSVVGSLAYGGGTASVKGAAGSDRSP